MHLYLHILIRGVQLSEQTVEWGGISQIISTQLKNYEDVSSILWNTRASVRVKFLGPIPLTASHVERPRRPMLTLKDVHMCKCAVVVPSILDMYQSLKLYGLEFLFFLYFLSSLLLFLWIPPHSLFHFRLNSSCLLALFILFVPSPLESTQNFLLIFRLHCLHCFMCSSSMF